MNITINYDTKEICYIEDYKRHRVAMQYIYDTFGRKNFDISIVRAIKPNTVNIETFSYMKATYLGDREFGTIHDALDLFFDKSESAA